MGNCLNWIIYVIKLAQLRGGSRGPIRPEGFLLSPLFIVAKPSPGSNKMHFSEPQISPFVVSFGGGPQTPPIGGERPPPSAPLPCLPRTLLSLSCVKGFNNNYCRLLPKILLLLPIFGETLGFPPPPPIKNSWIRPWYMYLQKCKETNNGKLCYKNKRF